MEPIDSREARARALAALDVGRVHAQLVRYGLFRARSRDLAAELAAKVLAEALDPDGAPWNPGHEPDLFRHLVGRLNGALATERKKQLLRSEPTVVTTVVELFHGPPPTPEELLDRKQRFEADLRRWRALRESFCDDADALARGVLDQYEDGTTDAAAQAEALRADVRDVYAQRKRISRRALALRADDESKPPPAPAIAARAPADEEVET